MSGPPGEAHRHTGTPVAEPTLAVEKDPTDRFEQGRRRPSLAALVLFGGLGAVLIVVGALAVAVGPGSHGPGGAAAPSAAQTVPAAQVQNIHTALHDMGARCTPDASTAAQRRIGTDVDRLIGFARRYLDTRFTIDGEDGRSLDLLLIAATEMRSCAPAAARRAEQALPPRYRSSPAPTAAPPDGGPGR